MAKILALLTRELPKPPRLKAILGPSFILLGLGLGSGELILWPYLSANFGLGIIWGALLGITFQFFLNMEIERYTLVRGESVFVGFARKFGRGSSIWFIFSTLIPWMWPGIIATSATISASLLGIKYTGLIPSILLILVGLILTLGPIIYKTQEIFQKSLILVSVPFILFLGLLLVKMPQLFDLAKGMVGIGQGYLFFPYGISLITFLGAFAYSGAGGNLNLVQSFYIKEKGYGMGKYSGRITSILTGKKENIRLTGAKFENSPENIKRFKLWWRRINLEHFLVFWLTGLATMLLLSLLAYTLLFGKTQVSGINFILAEAGIISQNSFFYLGGVFLLICSLMLFSTQFSVLDATSRIMSENLVILSEKFKAENLAKYYYTFLWLQILAGIAIFSLGFKEPLTLITIAAFLNAITMFVYSGLILWLNLTSLEKPLRPSVLRIIFILLAFVFYGGFASYIIFSFA